MQTKKDNHELKNGNKRKSLNGTNTAIVFADEVLSIGIEPKPRKLNPESIEERENRLAKRKTLTLKAFKVAYENGQTSKRS